MVDFQLHYHKRKIIDLGEFIDKNGNNPCEPYIVDNLQLYNPLYSKLFKLNHNNYNKISLNNKYHIKNLYEVYDGNFVDVSMNVFIKFSPLLDPIKYLTGKYDIEDPKLLVLPSITSTEENCHKKTLCMHNASYVDNFFYFLSSVLLNNHDFVHGIDYFGSFLGIQKEFQFNVSDDLEYISSSDFFIKNIGILFTANDLNISSEHDQHTRRKKSDISIGGFIDDIDIDMIDLSTEVITSECTLKKVKSSSIADSVPSTAGTRVDVNDTQCCNIVECEDDNVEDGNVKDGNVEDNFDNLEYCISDSDDSDNNSETNYSEIDDHESKSVESGNTSDTVYTDTDTDSDYTNEADDIFAHIKNFPAQMICLEKCENTLDHLFMEDDIDDEKSASILFQVVMTLLTYQKVFSFTHNDLHTNNIMFISTKRKFLWYKYKNVHYKVPTYGKIFKLIDFGRSIYNFKDDIFCSDSFFPDGDGDSQYNCEPFYDDSKKRIDRNFSFDLCRLGCSLYDFVFQPNTNYANLTQLQTTVKRWVTDDNNYNILYKRNGLERYRGFKLYKMISRTVTSHTPEKQLDFSYFNQFKCKSNNSKDIMNIDDLPVYHV
jgi:hypothetical protein